MLAAYLLLPLRSIVCAGVASTSGFMLCAALDGVGAGAIEVFVDSFSLFARARRDALCTIQTKERRKRIVVARLTLLFRAPLSDLDAACCATGPQGGDDV